jgi:hypothetical protein
MALFIVRRESKVRSQKSTGVRPRETMLLLAPFGSQTHSRSPAQNPPGFCELAVANVSRGFILRPSDSKAEIIAVGRLRQPADSLRRVRRPSRIQERLAYGFLDAGERPVVAQPALRS